MRLPVATYNNAMTGAAVSIQRSRPAPAESIGPVPRSSATGLAANDLNCSSALRGVKTSEVVAGEDRICEREKG